MSIPISNFPPTPSTRIKTEQKKKTGRKAERTSEFGRKSQSQQKKKKKNREDSVCVYVCLYV